MRARGRGIRNTLVATIGLLIAWPAAAHAATQATAYQLDAAHSGYSADAGVVPPLAVRWQVDFKQATSYPLIADGRVFAIVRNESAYGTVLHALDAGTGRELWSRALGGTYYWSGQAYGAGRVYTVNGDGQMQALDPTTGATIWITQLPGQYSFSSEPTYYDGIVYTGGAGSGGTLYAVDAATGTVLWSRSVANGDHSSPAVDAQRVYVSYSCPNVYAFERKTGAPAWSSNPGCSGGGGRTPVLGAGRLFVRDPAESGTVFDATTGQIVGSFPVGPAPVIAGDLAIVVNDGIVRTQNARTGAPGWTWAPEDGSKVTAAPIAAGGVVFAGTSSGGLVALDLQSGRPVWAGALGAEVSAPDEHNVSSPVAGLAAGEGLLVVPSGTRLVALAGGAAAGGGGPAQPQAAPSDTKLTLSIKRRSLVLGQRTSLAGRLTRAGKPVRRARVQIQADAYPYDDNWKPLGSLRTDRRGRFAGRLQTDRNTRVRAVAPATPGVSSRAVTIFTDLYAEMRWRIRRSGSMRVKVLIIGPRDWTPPDARAFVYRVTRKRGTLVATVPLKQRKAGEMLGSALGKLRRGTRRARLAFCVPEPADDGFGRHTPVDEACGAPTIEKTALAFSPRRQG